MARREHIWHFQPRADDDRYGYCSICGADMSNIDGELRHFTTYHHVRKMGVPVAWIRAHIPGQMRDHYQKQPIIAQFFTRRR